MLKFLYIMQGYAQEICRTRFFVGLRIEVDAPGVLAAIRPCASVCGMRRPQLSLGTVVIVIDGLFA